MRLPHHIPVFAGFRMKPVAYAATVLAIQLRRKAEVAAWPKPGTGGTTTNSTTPP